MEKTNKPGLEGESSESLSRRNFFTSAATIGFAAAAGAQLLSPDTAQAQAPACPETTLDKIKRMSEFSVGARQGVFPFGYLDKDNNWTGISTEIVREVHKAIEKELKTSVKLNLVPVTSQTRIPLLLNGTVDMDAGSTVVTQARAKVVDFCIPFLGTGLHLLLPAGSQIKGWKDLAGKRMGTVQGAFDPELYADLNKSGKMNPPVEIVAFRDHPDGFQALVNGAVVAYSTDGPILAGLRARAAKPQDWKIIDPELSSELYAFAVRPNDSKFRALVDATFVDLFHSGRFMKLYNQFLGPSSQVPFPIDANMKALLYLFDLPK
jgi:glutamate/aspartate transport system substrate-binding protein